MAILDWRPHTFPLDGHLVLIGPGRDRLLVLDPLAAYVWERLQRGESIDVMASDLAEGFGLTLERARADLTSLVDQWAHLGLFDGHPRESPPEGGSEVVARSALAFPVHASRAYRLYDRCLRVDYGDVHLLSRLHPLIAHLGTDIPVDREHVLGVARGEGGYVLVEAVRVDSVAKDVDSVALELRRRMFLLGHRGRPCLAVLHAAAVGWRGECLAFIGSSGSGKSTLAAALITDGLDYLGDDVVPIEQSTRRALPLPLPIKLGMDSVAALGLEVAPHALSPIFSAGGERLRFLLPGAGGGRVAEHSATVRAVVFPRFVAGADFECSALRPVEALQGVVESESVLGYPLEPERVGALLEWLAATPAYRLRYGDVGLVRHWVRERLGC